MQYGPLEVRFLEPTESKVLSIRNVCQRQQLTETLFRVQAKVNQQLIESDKRDAGGGLNRCQCRREALPLKQFP